MSLFRVDCYTSHEVLEALLNSGVTDLMLSEIDQRFHPMNLPKGRVITYQDAQEYWEKLALILVLNHGFKLPPCPLQSNQRQRKGASGNGRDIAISIVLLMLSVLFFFPDFRNGVLIGIQEVLSGLKITLFGQEVPRAQTGLAFQAHNFPHPEAMVEVCDNIDDDCDGVIDQEYNYLTARPSNKKSKTQTRYQDGCIPSPEVCDNIDNDCDGMVDNGFNTLNDEANCGVCGHSCPSGASCFNGHCASYKKELTTANPKESPPPT